MTKQNEGGKRFRSGCSKRATPKAQGRPSFGVSLGHTAGFHICRVDADAGVTKFSSEYLQF